MVVVAETVVGVPELFGSSDDKKRQPEARQRSKIMIGITVLRE